jgi:hypothetical protein
MKTEEDEAWEEMERKQGAGGFPAKRKMAADKLHWSDCAVHNAPAYPAGPCDCGVLQEPVAWADLVKEAQQIVKSKFLWKKFIDGTPLANDIACWMADFAQQHTTPPLPAQPPQRPWVGLTDDELADLWYKESLDWMEFARAHEAAWKEKNNG